MEPGMNAMGDCEPLPLAPTLKESKSAITSPKTRWRIVFPPSSFRWMGGAERSLRRYPRSVLCVLALKQDHVDPCSLTKANVCSRHLATSGHPSIGSDPFEDDIQVGLTPLKTPEVCLEGVDPLCEDQATPHEPRLRNSLGLPSQPPASTLVAQRSVDRGWPLSQAAKPRS